MTDKVVTFGEIMLRLAAPGFERFLQSPRFDATFGGGEANVAAALAGFGLSAAYVTVLPDNNPISDAAIAELRRLAWTPPASFVARAASAFITSKPAPTSVRQK